ncbi:hypothetical protein ScPMuIL_007225 [Solemya velum]
MAEIYEDAVEKLGRSFQEVGVDESEKSRTAETEGVQTNVSTCSSVKRGGNSADYIDIHIDGSEKTGTQVTDNNFHIDSDIEHTKIKLECDEGANKSVSEDTSNLITVDTEKSKITETVIVKDCDDDCSADFCKDIINDVEGSISSTDTEDEGSYHSADEGEEDDDEEHRKQQEDKMTEEEKKELQKQAQEEKEEGNKLFKEASYKEARKHYTRALKLCPLSFKKDRSIMFSNRAACKMRMELYEEAIKDSTSALDLNPLYLKALMRRAELYEKNEKLEDALGDYQKILEMDPSQYAARAACLRLPEEIKERNEKLKTEMLGKLKDLGNMVLKPFGLSTDNFQMKQDPATGSYSVNFSQGGK